MAKNSKKSATRVGPASAFAPPLTVSHAALIDAGSDQSFRELLYLMSFAFGRLQSCREAFARRVGLTGSQFAVLFGVAFLQRDRGVTVRELAAHVHLASTHVTTEVRRLVGMGMLQKIAHPEDGRSVLVTLTAQGEQSVTGVAPTIREVNDLLFKDVGRTDAEQARSFLTQLVLNSEFALAALRRLDQSEQLDAH